LLGSNADLFAQQILYRIVANGGKVNYYTVEHSSTDVALNMQLFGMNLEQYVKDGSWVFTRLVVPSMKNVIDAMQDLSQEKKIDLDSLSKLMKSFEESAKEGHNTALHLSHLIRNFSLIEIQNLLFFMTEVTRKYGGIHFLLMTEDSHEKSLVVTIKDAVDAVFEFASQVIEEEIENILTIRKVRNMIPKARVLRLSVKNSGLVTETTSRIS
jgi:KaiC/GvpD/RAD55 family RecA-like ATPase